MIFFRPSPQKNFFFIFFFILFLLISLEERFGVLSILFYFFGEEVSDEYYEYDKYDE